MTNYIVFDLEATCWEKSDLIPQGPNETIEIGALKFDKEGSLLSEFSTFIKPIKNPELSDFCRKLTSITQAQVDEAPLFPTAIDSFQKWIGVGEDDYLLCSWGYYDRSQLENDATIHNLDASWVNHHISIKHQYAEIKNLKKPVGMATALGMEKMKLEGVHHRGIDDARNISKLFLKFLNQWQKTNERF
jgi:3'-5' exoribonuclease 1